MEPNHPGRYTTANQLKKAASGNTLVNTDQFGKLCREASERLDLHDTAALGSGDSVSVRDVMFEATYTDGQDSFLLLADLGDVAPDDKVCAYEQLLTMQQAACDDSRVRFGFHPVDEAAVLCVGAGLDDSTDSTWLAGLLDCVASQVTRWRQTYFAGKVAARGTFAPAFASPI
jgi:hypothetical protein